jgi:hypothetical protein
VNAPGKDGQVYVMSDDGQMRWVDPPFAHDPLDGKWAALDQSPAASAQMIQWHAPQTYALIRAENDALRARIEALPRYDYGDGTEYVNAEALDAALTSGDQS